MRPASISSRLLALAWALLAAACGLGERDDVLVLVRADDPISQRVGALYAERRGVPDENVLALPISGPHDGAPIDPEAFENEIARPIESHLAAHDPDGEISILVTTTGIPLRIGRCSRSEPLYPRDCRSAAVDAALAGLGRLSPTAEPLESHPNPFFGDPRSFDTFRREMPGSRLRFLVARLTAPRTPIDGRGDVPRALRALLEADASDAREGPPLWWILADAPPGERTAASAALFDPIGALLDASDHRVCDGCDLDAGIDAASGVVLQRATTAAAGSGRTRATPASLARADDGPGAPRLAPPGLVIALDGPSGGRLDAFVGGWTERGARVFSTHIDDPSLGGVTRPALQLRAWAEGRSAVEAHFNSVPLLGWVNVFVGDPLLRLAEAGIDDDGDRDGDGVPDAEDNCLDVPNPQQRDSNADRVGNRCDPDVDDDGRVATSWGRIYPVDARGDLEAIALTARNGPHDPDHDLDGNGRVDPDDLAIAQLWLFRRPGPSGTTTVAAATTPDTERGTTLDTVRDTARATAPDTERDTAQEAGVDDGHEVARSAAGRD